MVGTTLTLMYNSLPDLIIHLQTHSVSRGYLNNRQTRFYTNVINPCYNTSWKAVKNSSKKICHKLLYHEMNMRGKKSITLVSRISRWVQTHYNSHVTKRRYIPEWPASSWGIVGYRTPTTTSTAITSASGTSVSCTDTRSVCTLGNYLQSKNHMITTTQVIMYANMKMEWSVVKNPTTSKTNEH